MKKYPYIILIFLFLFVVLASLAFYQQNFVQRPRIIFFDVGQGDAIMVDAKNNVQVLIDGGNGNDILDKLGKYMPFYDRKIELVISTHPDKDHMGGLVEVLKYYKVGQVLETGIVCKTAICREWNKLIAEKNIPIEYAQFGQNMKIESGVKVVVLYPFENMRSKKVKNDNDASIVLKLVLGDDSYLLTGDAGFKVENNLLNKNINIESRILKVSHHGSKYATSSEFLKTVGPEGAIVSVGKNEYGHPAEELMNRLRNINVEIFRTDKMGDLVFN
jgi:competence protein ComEC